MPTYTKETALYDTGKIDSEITAAGETASKYITTVGNDGISVHAENSANSDYSLINSTGLTVYSDSTQRAHFGEETYIGKPYDSTASDNEAHMELNYHSFKGIDRENKEYFNFSDLRNADGDLSWHDRFIGDGVTQTFYLSLPTYIVPYGITVNGESADISMRSNDSFTLRTAPNVGDIIIASYWTHDTRAKAYTLGYRSGTPYEIGPMSHALGCYCKASGPYSHAEGFDTTASGFCSHAQNGYTKASGVYQTAIGKYNVEATDKAFIIGNGSDDSNRSNALTVDWYGNVVAAGNVSAVTGTFSSTLNVTGVSTFGGNVVPSATNSKYLGVSANRWNAVYTRHLYMGMPVFGDSNAVISSVWADGGNHNLLERADDGLTSYFGWSGSSTYQTDTRLRGYKLTLYSAGGGISMTGAVTTSSTITAGAVQSYTPTWASGQTPSTYRCVVSAGICSFSYMGAAAAQATEATIATLPVGARPVAQLYVPFVKMTGGIVGTIRITTAGAVVVASTTSTTNTGRIYFNCTFPVV